MNIIIFLFKIVTLIPPFGSHIIGADEFAVNHNVCVGGT